MRRRPWPAVAALLVGAAAITLTVVTRDSGDRAATLGLIVSGLAAGVAAATLRRRPAADRAAPQRKTVAERLNDVAFGLVVTAVWALVLAVSGPWPGLLTGVLVGAAVARASRG